MSSLIKHSSGLWIRRGEYAMQDAEVICEVLVNDGYKLNDIVTSTGKAGEVVIDVGAHIGTFATMWRRKNYLADVVCVEVCPENWEALEANVGLWATIVKAACTYEREVVLHSSIFSGGTATGGSYVAKRGEALVNSHLHRVDDRPVKTVTLEDILRKHGKERVDVLKLDCEGSEFSILRGFTKLNETRWVVGEYHGSEMWDEMREELFDERWRYRHISGGSIGTFIYENTSLH